MISAVRKMAYCLGMLLATWSTEVNAGPVDQLVQSLTDQLNHALAPRRSNLFKVHSDLAFVVRPTTAVASTSVVPVVTRLLHDRLARIGLRSSSQLPDGSDAWV